MKRYLFFTCLFVYYFLNNSCIQNPNAPVSKQSDTTFLERVIIDTTYEGVPTHFYHAVFIEKNKNSNYYKDVSDFSFNQYENLDDYNKELRRKKVHLRKFNTQGLPKEWLPLNLHKGRYYLYTPSDWGNLGRRMISDSSVIFWFMDGPLPYVLESVKKISDTSYTLKTKNYLFNCKDCVYPQTLNIYIIDKINKIAVWEYKNENEKNYNYSLYVPKENIKNFDMIVNYCKTDKQMEVEFEQPDFVNLLRNFPRK